MKSLRKFERRPRQVGRFRDRSGRSSLLGGARRWGLARRYISGVRAPAQYQLLLDSRCVRIGLNYYSSTFLTGSNRVLSNILQQLVLTITIFLQVFESYQFKSYCLLTCSLVLFHATFAHIQE